MDYTDFDGFMDKILKQLWPNWNPSDAESRLWRSRIAPYDYGDVKNVVEIYFADKGAGHRRPRLDIIIQRLQGTITHRQRPESDPEPDFYIQCVEAPEGSKRPIPGRKTPIYVLPRKKRDDPDYVSIVAEQTRQKYNALYKGNWIIITKPSPAYVG